MHNNRLYEQARFYLERSNLLESQLNETSEITEAILDELLNTLEDQVNFYSSLVEMRDYTTKERLADTPEGEALRTKLTRRAERIRGLADRFNRGKLKFHGSDSDDPNTRKEGGERAAARISHMMKQLGDSSFRTSTITDIAAGEKAMVKTDPHDLGYARSKEWKKVTSATPVNLHSFEDEYQDEKDPDASARRADKARAYHGVVGRENRKAARELGAKEKAAKQKVKARTQLQVPGAVGSIRLPVGKHAHEHVRDPESFGGLDAGEESKDSRFSP